MNAPRATSRSGFTLLESIIALAIIGAVAGACLQVRAQSLAGRQRLTVRQNADRGIDTILRLAQAGLLNDGQSEKNEENQITRITWTGDHLGEPFTCERTRAQLTNPIDRAGDEAIPATVTMWRWTVEYRNESAEMFTPARAAR